MSATAPVAGASRDIVVRNPYDGSEAGRVRAATAAEAEAATLRAKHGRVELRPHERADVLRAAAAALRERSDEFAESICAECGTARRDAAKEISRSLEALELSAEEARRLNGESLATDATPGRPRALAVTRYEPRGTILAITPFNRPLAQVVTKLAPAVGAGNAVVLKPSERTPLTAALFAEVLVESGFPGSMLELVCGHPDEVGDALVGSPHVDMLTFTGSARVGRALARRAGMIETAFELGDSAALIVMPGADLACAARVAAAGAFSSAGQSCRGVKRVIAHDDVADELVGLLAAEARALRVGDPRDPDTDVGTLIDEAAAAAVEARVEEAVAHGAALVTGGRREGAQVWPTVLDRVDRELPLVAAETFGPCAPVIRVRDADDAIECANATEYGLQAGIFCADLATALRCARELDVGTVAINDGPQFEAPLAPFGGEKSSGLGREGIPYSMRAMSTLRTVVVPWA